MFLSNLAASVVSLFMVAVRDGFNIYGSSMTDDIAVTHTGIMAKSAERSNYTLQVAPRGR